MKKPGLLTLLIVLLLAACGGKKKKVIVMSSGKFEVNGATIKLEPGTQHNEGEITTNGNELHISNGSTTTDIQLTEEGLYVLNLKTDTMTGSAVKYGEGGRPPVITAEAVDRMIDSTQQLMLGKNASDVAKTFWVIPMTAKKLSGNYDARVIGPYKGIPFKVEVDEKGNQPEMYKFFTNKQKRETIADLVKEREEIIKKTKITQ